MNDHDKNVLWQVEMENEANRREAEYLNSTIQSVDIPQLQMTEAVRLVAQHYEMSNEETIQILQELIERIGNA